MLKAKVNKLSKISKILKKKIIEISYLSKAHHIGSELSCIDMMTVLYFYFLNINKQNLNKKNRDYFLLSKGHAALALYVTLMGKGFFSESYLKKNFLSNGGIFGGHPDYNAKKGIDSSSGSLGQCLSIGAGIALSLKKDHKSNKVVVMIGDGELNEGMIWEAIMFASHHKLDNLLCVVDNNKLQGLGKSKNINNLEPIIDKINKFGWKTYSVNGHNIKEILTTLDKSNKNTKKPKMIIANSIKGYGVNFMENKLSSHYQVLDKEMYSKAIKDIEKNK